MIIAKQKSALNDRFIKQFGIYPSLLISAAGRTELGGNHTDHQNGQVIAAAVDLQVSAVFISEMQYILCSFKTSIQHLFPSVKQKLQ